jgi:CRISPR-associated endonuclease Csn1
MANDAYTKVKVIKGSYTHQMRCNLKLDKNRDEGYSHHAVDAMLIGYSELVGANSVRPFIISPCNCVV